MNEQPKTGMNRTGMQMSPIDAGKMQDSMKRAEAGRSGDAGAGLAEIRRQQTAESELIGSVPPPATAKGMVKTGASALAGNSPQLFLDKLGERLAFERTGTRLYDALIAKVEGARQEDARVDIPLAMLKQIRDEEAAHFQLVADAIMTLGGDPTAQTPCADLAGVEAMGLVKVVSDPRTTVAQALHSILVAEMTDNAGWNILIALAQAQKQDDMASDFAQALEREREHLQQVRAWVEEGVLGEPISVQPVAGAKAKSAKPKSKPLH